MPDTVQVFTTGGTIDKEYFDAKSAYEIGEPQIGALLREAGVAFPYVIGALMRKDSLDLTNGDRQEVAEHILASPHRRVIVTHGTDTMAATARVVADALAAAEGERGAKTVVFVGSLSPARFKGTDAEFNVGFAAAAAQTLPPGAYVAMNGCVFDPHHVRKDRDRNRFETVPEAPPPRSPSPSPPTFMIRLSLSGALALVFLASGCSTASGIVDDVEDAIDDATGMMMSAAPCVDGRATLPGSAPGADIGPFECSDVNLVAYVPLATFDADQLNDIWGWTDPETGREYALVGLANGTEFVDVTDPMRPVLLGKLPTQTVSTVWRDIKVYRDHAFVVSEARNHGMQVFDLTRLRGLTSDQGEFDADAHYDGVTNVHNLVINEDSGFAYAVGSGSRGSDLPAECGAPGFHVINIQNPTSPTFAGCFSDASKDTAPVSAPGYTHDAQCINYDGPDPDYRGREICAGSNEDVVTFFDVTDKSDVRIISMAEYPQDAYTHQNWFTDDRRFVLANDELDEQNGFVSTQRTMIFNVENLDEPEFVGIYDSGITTIDHNLYIIGNLAYMSNYQSGLRIVNISGVASGTLREVAFFDTYPQGTEVGFAGQWSNYPYFESGIVVASDSDNGLFVLRPRM